MRSLLSACAAIAVFAVASCEVKAQTPPLPCVQDFPTAQVASYLRIQHNERPVAFGLTAPGHAVQIYASPKGKTWTLVVSSPEGRSCILSAGKNWTGAPDAGEAA